MIGKVVEKHLKTSYVLIDYENVQPTDLALLQGGSFKVRVFLGPKQKKIPFDLAAALQPLGSDAGYVAVETSGANALDFHIAYYLGTLSCQEPSASFHILSKDSGFDPLITHLGKNGVRVRRSERIAEVLPPSPVAGPPRSVAVPAEEAQIAAVIENLVRRKSARPRAKKTLLNTIRTLFKKPLSERQLSSLFDSLCSRGIVRVDGSKVSYQLPAQ